MTGNRAPFLKPPDWLDHLVATVALSVSLGALVSYVVFIFPDPDPLVALPSLGTVPPVLWTWVAVSLVSLPLFRWPHAGERITRWWDRQLS